MYPIRIIEQLSRIPGDQSSDSQANESINRCYAIQRPEGATRQ